MGGWTQHRAKPAEGNGALAMTTMGKAGLNLKDLPEFLDPEFALINENFFVANNRGLSKRKGLIKATEVAGGYPITMFKEWKGYFMFTYNKTLAAYNPATNAVITIKSDWVTDDRFAGAPYGDYFFVGNLGNKINYVTETVGVFIITEIAAAPKSSVIVAVGPRLFAGVGDSVMYCNVDDGTNPPFQIWNVAAIATSGGQVSFRNAGIVNAIASLGDTIIAFGDTGKFAFKLVTQADGTGTTIKIEEVVIDRVDMGGASGAITTPKGIFYVNSAGLWQMTALGQPNIAWSDQEHLTSVNLGTDYFNDVDLTNCDLAYFTRFSTVLVTCAKESSRNNHIIAFNHDMRAFSTFRNWNINRWMVTGDEIYGGSSIKTAIYHCFAGGADDGVAISVKYQQELKLQTGVGKRRYPVPLWDRQTFMGGYIKGFLHQLSVVGVVFDIYNRLGEKELNKLKLIWTPQSNNNTADGWGTAEWGKSAWGGDTDRSNLIESFDGNKRVIRNFQRIILNINENSKLPLEIDWVSIQSKPKGPIRRRKMTLAS